MFVHEKRKKKTSTTLGEKRSILGQISLRDDQFLLQVSHYQDGHLPRLFFLTNIFEIETNETIDNYKLRCGRSIKRLNCSSVNDFTVRCLGVCLKVT